MNSGDGAGHGRASNSLGNISTEVGDGVENIANHRKRTAAAAASTSGHARERPTKSQRGHDYIVRVVLVFF